MNRRTEFRLQFKPARIRKLAELYKAAMDDKEPKALAAGGRISEGSRARSDFLAIVDWKTKRVKSRVRKNIPGEIADALSLAISAKTDRAAIAVLVGLNGVAVPVASAILTAIDPDKYTVIDFRALEALGNDSSDRSVDFCGYLNHCRLLAKKHQVTLRELDRALWRWSWEQGQK